MENNANSDRNLTPQSTAGAAGRNDIENVSSMISISPNGHYTTLNFDDSSSSACSSFSNINKSAAATVLGSPEPMTVPASDPTQRESNISNKRSRNIKPNCNVTTTTGSNKITPKSKWKNLNACSTHCLRFMRFNKFLLTILAIIFLFVICSKIYMHFEF